MADDAGQQFMFTPPREPSGTKWSASHLTLALWLIGIFLVEGVASGITWPTVLQRLQPLSSKTVGQVVRQAHFVSSGLLSANPESSQGITDQLVIELNNVPFPQRGTSYYAWLLNDKTLEWNPIPLGQLTVNNGAIDFAYVGDAQHSDLLATNSRFLITEEVASSLPVVPSSDSSRWRYYAEFSQTPDPTNPKHYSLYDHIRHLL